MRRATIVTGVMLAALLVLGAGDGRKPGTERGVDRGVPTALPVVRVPMEPAIVQPSILNADDAAADQTAESRAGGFVLRRWSVNSGGTIGGVSGSLRAGVSAGQTVAGSGTAADHALRAGFWHGLASGCPVTLTGDANGNGIINATDAIVVVNYVFRAGPEPVPCAAAADVNCSGLVNATDIIYLVNYVFRAGPAPCDVCTMIPGVYSCP